MEWFPLFYALGKVIFLIYLTLAIMAICVIVFIWKFRRRPLIVIPTVVILAVGITLLMNRPPPPPSLFATNEAIGKKAELACDSQLPKLAEVYEVDAIADTVTALTGESIVRLLVNRQLAFIEIKVQPPERGIQHQCPPNAKNCVLPPPPSNLPYILPSTSFPDNSWTVDSAAGSYAKIELVDKSTNTCAPISSLHKSITGFLRAYPLPFDKCIKMSFNPVPTARHLLRYQAAPNPKKGLLDYELRLGYYQLIDTKNNSVLAQLATSNNPRRSSMEMSVSTLNPHTLRPNCGSPHTALMDRLFRTGYKALNTTELERNQVRDECESQLSKLAKVEVDAIADTVTALDRESIRNLLIRYENGSASKKLAFVEIKVQQGLGTEPFIVRPKHSSDVGWTVDKPIGSYVKIELTEKSTGNCLATSVLNNVYLPDNLCLKTSHSSQPTARYVLSYQADPHSRNGLLGHYQLIDTKDNSVLAQLATSDNPQQPTMPNSYRDRDRDSCRSPHAALVSKLSKIGDKARDAKWREALEERAGLSSDSQTNKKYFQEVRDYTMSYAVSSASDADYNSFAKGISDIAAKAGISNWEQTSSTYVAMGQGLKRAGITGITYDTYKSNFAHDNATNIKSIQQGYDE